MEALTHDDGLQHAQGLLHIPDLRPAGVVPLACNDKRVLKHAEKQDKILWVGATRTSEVLSPYRTLFPLDFRCAVCSLQPRACCVSYKTADMCFESKQLPQAVNCQSKQLYQPSKACLPLERW